jgi:hypothetical protein
MLITLLGSEVFHSGRRGYAAKLAVVAMSTQLSKVQLEFVCATKLGDHICSSFARGAEAFEALPVAIRNFGPWTGGAEGEIVVIVSQLELEVRECDRGWASAVSRL